MFLLIKQLINIQSFSESFFLLRYANSVKTERNGNLNSNIWWIWPKSKNFISQPFLPDQPRNMKSRIILREYYVLWHQFQKLFLRSSLPLINELDSSICLNIPFGSLVNSAIYRYLSELFVGVHFSCFFSRSTSTFHYFPCQTNGNIKKKINSVRKK